ncbi:MAG: class I SAM-dependent methyltransferase [Pyrinomonadaceae bacterium]|nr:class I SAM-dependent methyltransferase [Pyrinomonadaceae bacterium]
MFEQARHIDSLSDCFFYHTMDLPGFGEVRGQWDLRGRFDDYVGGVSLSGKKVLDVGTATGFLSFEAEKRLAGRVLSFDLSDARQFRCLPFKDKLYYRDHERWAEQYRAEIEQWKNAYWLCHRLLDSRAEVFYGDIYDLPPELGQFDVAIVGSVLEHLSDPISALASITRLTKETVIVVTPLLEVEDRMARFHGSANHPENDFTWWIYSTGLYREVFKMLGFSIVQVTNSEYYYHYGERLEKRSTIVVARD